MKNIYLIHIPITSGQLVKQSLENAYFSDVESKLLYVYPTKGYMNLQEFLDHQYDHAKKHLISSNVSYQKIKIHLPQECIKTILLRDPLDAILHYYYKVHTEESVSLIDFFKENQKQLSNWQSSLITGEEISSSNEKEVLAKAKHILENEIHAVGIQDYIAEFINYIGMQIQAEPINLDASIIPNIKSAPLSREDIEYIKDCNQVDIQLYNHIKYNLNEFKVFRNKHNFSGYIDSISQIKMTGWAWMTGNDKPVEIQIEVNGHIEKIINANQYRDDLKSAGIGNGQHSFEYFFRNKLSENDQVKALIKDTDQELLLVQ